MITLKNGYALINDSLEKVDILIDNEKIIKIGKDINSGKIIDCTNLTILPSFIDCHVHFREPGFEYKSDILEGSRCACKGGYTEVFMMPNLKPSPSTKESVELLNNLTKKSVIKSHILGTITKDELSNELSDMKNINEYVLGFSDDGKGVKTSDMMYQAMLIAKSLNKPIIAHCEDETLLYGGKVRENIWNKENNIKGILPFSETIQLARDLVLVEQTNVKYHMCHISSKQSLDLITYYKSKGLNVSVEVTPHQLILNETNLKNEGRFKMNPPLSSESDQFELIKGIIDGRIDMISTDHAPHSNEEKSKDLNDAPFGIVGLETAFPLIYTHFVKTNKISLKKMCDLMSFNESKIFNLNSHEIKENNLCNIVIVDLNSKYKIKGKDFISKCKLTPFEDMEVYGKVKYTIYNGGIVYEA